MLFFVPVTRCLPPAFLASPFLVPVFLDKSRDFMAAFRPKRFSRLGLQHGWNKCWWIVPVQLRSKISLLKSWQEARTDQVQCLELNWIRWEIIHEYTLVTWTVAWRRSRFMQLSWESILQWTLFGGAGFFCSVCLHRSIVSSGIVVHGLQIMFKNAFMDIHRTY